jgi:hypothetical protein
MTANQAMKANLSIDYLRERQTTNLRRSYLMKPQKTVIMTKEETARAKKVKKSSCPWKIKGLKKETMPKEVEEAKRSRLEAKLTSATREHS